MKYLRRIAGVLLIVYLMFIVSFMARKQAGVRPNQKDQPSSEDNPALFPKDRNHLANEKSPYLLQHADNPVDWYPWSVEAFAKAKKRINLFSYRLAILYVIGVMSLKINGLIKGKPRRLFAKITNAKSRHGTLTNLSH